MFWVLEKITKNFISERFIYPIDFTGKWKSYRKQFSRAVEDRGLGLQKWIIFQ